MLIDRNSTKEELNRQKHGLDFSFADHVLSSPLNVTVYDRFENGEHRWHTFAHVGDKLLLVVYSFPDPEDEEWVRVIGLREATQAERKRYEEGNFD